MSIFQQHVTIGREQTYAVPVTASRSYDVRSDDWQLDVDRINTDGIYRGRQTMRTDRDRLVVLGATGSLETTIYDDGMLYLLRDILGASSGPTNRTGAEAGAYDTQLTSTTEGPVGSYTIQLARSLVAGAIRPATYAGCVPVSWNISTSVGDDLRIAISYDAESEALDRAEVTPAYTGQDVPYIWEDVDISIDGSDLETASSFSLDAELGMKTDRRFLRGEANKERPVRMEQPEYSGTIEAEYTPETHIMYQDFIRDESFSIVMTATSPAGQIGSTGVTPSFKVTLHDCKFTGETPKMAMDELSTINLPFTVFHDGTNPAVTIDIVSADTAY